MTVEKIPVSRSRWEGLSPGDGIEDRHGRLWGVVTKDMRDPLKLTAHCPGYDNMVLVWKKGRIYEEIDGGNYPLYEFEHTTDNTIGT